MWVAKDSFRYSLINVLKKLEDSAEKEEALNQVYMINLNSSQEENENKRYEDLMDQIKACIAQISDLLRVVKSSVVTVQAFCDVLWLYANTNTYFTPNENYQKCKGDEQKIRKCDVRIENQSQEALHPAEQEKQVYKGCKEYDPGYIWGQLVGWFKQTVDKPNASLSADRRGTLSMPDLESFLVTHKNQENLKSGIKKSKKKKQDDDDDQIDETSFLKSGTKSRPTAQQSFKEEEEKRNEAAGSSRKIKDVKVTYPHKKYQSRQDFLQNWPSIFSKQWDVICHWSFKNKNRMYGSVQFESVLRADNRRDLRLYYFQNVLNHLLKFK